MGMHIPPPSALCAFSMSSIICLSLFIPQSTVKRLDGLSLSFSLSHFTFQICLFTPRATLPHLKLYLSSAECFRAVPHVNTRLSPPPPFKKKTNTSYLLLMHRRSLNSYFREKTCSWPSNCHRVIPADPPIIQRNRSALSLKRFRSRAERRDWHLLRSPQTSRKKTFAEISDTSSDLCICQLKSYFFPVGRQKDIMLNLSWKKKTLWSDSLWLKLATATKSLVSHFSLFRMRESHFKNMGLKEK